MKFAEGKTSSANVPHLNVWGFDISAAEFPQPKKTRVFGVNRPLDIPLAEIKWLIGISSTTYMYDGGSNILRGQADQPLNEGSVVADQSQSLN